MDFGCTEWVVWGGLGCVWVVGGTACSGRLEPGCGVCYEGFVYLREFDVVEG